MIEKTGLFTKGVAEIMHRKPRGTFIAGKTRIPWDPMSICTEVAESLREACRRENVTKVKWN